MGNSAKQITSNLDNSPPKEKIRVLRIIARMNIGGPAVQVTGLMQELDSTIFEQKLVTGFVASNEADYLIEKNIYIPVTRIEGLGRSVRPYSDLMAFIRLAKIMRSFKPDIIHTHTAKAGVLGRIGWIFLGYKPILIHTYHGHLLHGYFGKFKTTLVTTIEKILAIPTHRFLAVGKKVAYELLQAGIGNKDKFQVMPPGLSIEALPDRNLICNKYELETEKFYCTFLGRITDIKKPIRFLEIAEHFKDSRSNVHFLLVGSGELLDLCKKEIEKRDLPVTALGWVSEVEEILAMTDLMLLTSENEGMPLSLIQAGMAGIPSISTDVGSVSEVIVDGSTGYVLDFDSLNFAKQIVNLIQDKKLYKELGDNAKKHMLDNFGVQRLAEDHKKAYLELLNQR